jgi:hypothetical protein
MIVVTHDSAERDERPIGRRQHERFDRRSVERFV